MRKTVVISILMIFCLLSLYGDDGQSNSETKSGLTHLEVVLGPTLSSLCIGLLILEDAYFGTTSPSFEKYYIDMLTIAGAHVPAIISDPLEGGLLLALSASQWATAEIVSGQYTAFFEDFIWSHPSHLAMFSTYTAYRSNRLKASSALYKNNWREKSLINQWISQIDFLKSFERNTKWKSYSFLDLSLATIDPDNFLDPMIWPIFIGGIIPFFINPDYYAFWNHDRAFIGTIEVAPVVAVPVMAGFFLFESIIIAVTEEAHFRGFLYEEMGSAFGPTVAKFVDASYFPAIHIPTDLFSSQYNQNEIVLKYLQRSALTIYLDLLYDRGGLALSTTAHMWIDFTLFFSKWLLVSGIPHADIPSMLNIIFPLTLEYTIAL